jgi:hypothetical protein
MIRPTCRAASYLLCIAAFCASLHSQTENTITVRLVDAKTGHSLEPSNFLIRIDHQQAVHADWVRQNEDQSGVLKLPREASLVSIQATYDSAMQVYVNCDSAGDKPSPVDRWYKVSDILASGIVAPNACSKLKEVANPGEFVFFVRKSSWKEQLRDISQ